MNDLTAPQVTEMLRAVAHEALWTRQRDRLAAQR